MAAIEDLVAEVADPDVRMRLQAAVRALKEHKRFGLVFEEHIPELSVVPGAEIAVETLVRDRRESDGAIYRVVKMLKSSADLVPVSADGTRDRRPLSALQAVRRFGEPVYPSLQPLGGVFRSDERRAHTVINGENFHALQLLQYLHGGQVDCIYIDPPYNTGARDWKYNNQYVDSNDAWRHSKWLAFMQKRLLLARRLLKPDGVLVCTIDEHEVHHLGVLLEQLFPDARLQMVSICIQPSGASSGGLSRVDEYAFFAFFGDAQPVPMTRDLLQDRELVAESSLTWESLLRRGNAWYRRQRPNLCYPVLIDPDAHRIAGIGSPFSGTDEAERPRFQDGYALAWPMRTDGRLGIWRVDGARLADLAARGYAYVGTRDDARDTWTVRYLMEGTIRAIETGAIEIIGRGERGQVVASEVSARRTVAKTIWKSARHYAGGAGGTQLLSALLGERNRFTYPKSVYAVEDAIDAAIGNRRNALIVDFFAGSGTTLHATALLNARDGGSRRCVLVTNNEVDDVTSRDLRSRGVYPGDRRWEVHGVFSAVTRPRCEAAISGRRSDGAPVPGEYSDGRLASVGFDENVEFYDLTFLDPDQVDLGWQFAAVLPALWMRAGAVGRRPEFPVGEKLAMWFPQGANFAVLFDEASVREFATRLAASECITHAYLITDSTESFAEMRTLLRPGVHASMLYRDYLRSFSINMAGVS